MLYDIMTVIIITLSIMPPAMLQYYAFEPLLTERKKRLVLGGYAVILLAELFFFLYMIPFGPWSHSYSFYKKLFTVPLHLGRRRHPALSLPSSLRLFRARDADDFHPYRTGPPLAGLFPG